jgi:hypothetical protein
VRAEPDRAARSFRALSRATHPGQHQAVMALRQREVWIEAERGFERLE